jgi:agmatinase
MAENELPRFCDLPDDLTDLSTAAAAIVPVPFDRTSTWKKGAEKGPQAILEASHHIEWYDLATGTEPYRSGIATLPPVECEGPPEELADLVGDRVASLIGDGVLPVVLGGDHSVSIGAIRAASKLVPGMSVLQIDAHSDSRDEYAGSAFNHACVMARAREWCQVVQVGIRAVDTSELALLDPIRVIYAHQINGPVPEPH